MDDGKHVPGRMERLNLTVGIIGFLILGALILGSIWMFFRFLTGVDSTVGAALLGSLTAVFGALGTHYLVKQRQVEESHREEKTRLYTQFLDITSYYLARDNKAIPKTPIDEKDIVRSLFDFKSGLILRGSPKVIRSLAKFEDASASAEKEEGSIRVLYAIDDVFRAIRSDLGLSNRGLKKGELMGVFIRGEDRRDLIR